jgi:hypothetical protein
MQPETAALRYDFEVIVRHCACQIAHCAKCRHERQSPQKGFGKETVMKRVLALASAALMAIATLGIATVPASAQHWRHGGWHGGGWHGGGWHGGGWHRGHDYYYGGVGAGILGGLIVGSALASPYYDCGYYGCGSYYYGPRVVYRPRVIYRTRGRLSAAHVQWCYDRYRSYRAYDNTYQPYNGPRRQCYSPYG